jgi:flagellar secretion chaperone FliS
METFVHETYLETEVATATPQRLRLMLIEAALRRARQAEAALAAANQDEASAALVRCREIVGELIAGIQPERLPVARAVLGLHVYLLSTLTEIGQSGDAQQLAAAIRVLEEERQTWQDLCLLLPGRVAETAPSGALEELAPKRVAGSLDGAFTTCTEAFSIDA